MGVIFKSFGHFIPESRVTNKELAERFGVTEEWILERTGIEERRYFESGATSDMAVLAANNCFEHTDVKPEEIDLLIVATMTPDYQCPSTAAIVHKKLNLINSSGFDLMAACSGFLYALELGQSLIEAGKYKNILIAGADKMSSCIDLNDRKTTLVLSDGAGVCLLQHSETENQIIDTFCKLQGNLAEDIVVRQGGSACPLNETNIHEQDHYLRFESREIFQNGVYLFQHAIEKVISKNNLTLNDFDLIIPHQANKRIIEKLSENLKVPISKFVINIEKIGNSSAATVPIAMSELFAQERLKGKILTVSIGAGFTYSASILQFD